MAHTKTSYPVQWAAGLLSCLFSGKKITVPENVVLTSFHGDGYRGNTRIIFEKLCGHPELKPVWLSRNPKLVRQLKDQFGDNRAFLTHSMSGIRALRGSGAVFLTHGTSDYPFMRLPRHALVIQTYHGLPTKRGEYLRPRSDRPPGFLHRLILEYRFRPITHFLSSSPLVSRLFSSRFNIPPEKFLEFGYPAYDSLVHPHRPARPLARFWPDAPEAQKLILYAPTFRRRRQTRLFPFYDLDLEGIARWLEQNDALMALRAHPNEGLDVGRYLRIDPRFVSADQTMAEDAAELLPFTDVIISDYSSIYLEGLLTDTPAVFLPYDLANYERGLPLPYLQIAPGPVISSQKQFLDALGKAITRTDGFEEERRRVRDLYFSTVDGNATGRVIRFLEEQLLR